MTIQWATQSETNNAGWNIFRAASDDFNASQKINMDGLIEGSGNSSEMTKYSYVDNSDLSGGNRYWYWLQSNDYSGNTTLFGPIIVEIDDIPDNPIPVATIKIDLQQNYPNPFNPETIIKFAVEEKTDVVLTIYNVKGQKVIELFRGTATPEKYMELIWDGTDSNGNNVSSGIYLYKLDTHQKSYIKRMLLLK